MNAQQSIAVDPARPGGDKTVILIVGGRSCGKTRTMMALIDAMAKGYATLIDAPDGRGVALRFHTASDLPPAPNTTPIWSADYRNKRGRR